MSPRRKRRPLSVASEPHEPVNEESSHVSNNAPPDPPMEPWPETTRWFESGPSAILNDPALATLIVRIGMVSNALSAQFRASRAAAKRQGGAGIRDSLCLLVTSAALTNEAVNVVRDGKKQLQPLALKGAASNELIQCMGQLCAGRHPAAKFLSRARNKLGFHWDAETIGHSVQEFAKRKKLVWMETDAEKQSGHRLASAVLAHALIPSATQAKAAERKRAVDQEMAHISDAMTLIIKFCTAAAFGFTRLYADVRMRESDAAPGKSSA